MKVPRSRRRGKSRIFQVNRFRAVARVSIIKNNEPMNGRIIRLFKDVYRTAPMMEIKFENGSTCLLPAFNGAYVGKMVTYLKDDFSDGAITKLKDVPLGTSVYNIELKPNDGGKLVRAGGLSAQVMERSEDRVAVALPSSSILNVNPECRAVIGKIANGGRIEKPFYKAGNKHHLIRARGRYWPMNATVAMNAYEHKFGGKRRSTQHKAKSSARMASPGAKVGSIAPRRTGKR